MTAAKVRFCHAGLGLHQLPPEGDVVAFGIREEQSNPEPTRALLPGQNSFAPAERMPPPTAAQCPSSPPEPRCIAVGGWARELNASRSWALTAPTPWGLMGAKSAGTKSRCAANRCLRPGSRFPLLNPEPKVFLLLAADHNRLGIVDDNNGKVLSKGKVVQMFWLYPHPL